MACLIDYVGMTFSTVYEIFFAFACMELQSFIKATSAWNSDKAAVEQPYHKFISVTV